MVTKSKTKAIDPAPHNLTKPRSRAGTEGRWLGQGARTARARSSRRDVSSTLSTLTQEPLQQQSAQRFITLASYALVIGILWVGETVIMPIVFAALLSFLLSPALRRLMRWKVPKILAITAIVLAVFGVVSGLGWLMDRKCSSSPKSCRPTSETSWPRSPPSNRPPLLRRWSAPRR